jgi:hypothetical protein
MLRAPWNYTTSQRKHMMELVTLAIFVAEDGLVTHHWEERLPGLANFICTSTGEWCKGQEAGVAG